MHKSDVMAKIREVGLVPVLRADSEEEALAIAYALEAGGVTVLEVTMTVPGAVDAIRRAHSDKPAAVEKALKTTKLASRLGGTYAPDDHNHAHTPLFIIGLRDGKPAVIATE